MVSDTHTQEFTLLSGAASSGDSTIEVLDGSLFSDGAELLLLSQQGADRADMADSLSVEDMVAKRAL